MNFRIHRNHTLVTPPREFPTIHLPDRQSAGDPDLWAQVLQRAFNLFYGAAAVKRITIGRKGRHFYEWTVQLFDGNQPSWVVPHLPTILGSIRSTRASGGFAGPEGIRVIGPGAPEGAHFVSEDAASADKKAAPRAGARAPEPKLPTAIDVIEMSERFKSHRGNTQLLLNDVQKITDEQWPVADPRYEGNSAEQIASMLHPIERKIGGAKTVRIDMTLAKLMADLDSVIEDFAAAENNVAWARKGLAPRQAAADAPAPPEPKLPTAFELKEMSDRFKAHRDNVQSLLNDAQKITSERWPVSDPYCVANLAEQFVVMLHPIEMKTRRAKTIEIDMTLASLMADLDDIIEDFEPGENQGAWAKEVLASPDAGN